MSLKTKKLPSYILYAVFISGIAWVLYLARSNLVFFLLGTAIAYILFPAVKSVEQGFKRFAKLPFRLQRVLSILLVYAIFFYILGLLIFVFGGIIVHQFEKLIGQFSISSSALRQIFAEYTKDIDILQRQEIDQFITQVSTNIGDMLQSLVQFGSVRALNLVTSTISILFNLILLPIWMFYLMYSPRSLLQGILNLIPKSLRNDAKAMGGIVHTALSSYIRGQLILCISIGIATYLGLLLLQVPYPLPLAIIAGILEAVPIVGPNLSAIPAIFIASTISWKLVILVIVLYFVIQQLENAVLVPRIQGHHVEMPAVVVILLLAIGAALQGIVGMIIILPITAALRDIFHYLFLRLDHEKLDPEEVVKKVKSEPLSIDTI